MKPGSANHERVMAHENGSAQLPRVERTRSDKLRLLLAALPLACGAAFAQSSVTLYGVIDIGLAYQTINSSDNPQFNGSRFGMNNGIESGSRFGLRGSEDMGNGTRATFTLENGFDAGNGTLSQGGRLFGRQAWVGLENTQWGFVRAGLQYNFATDFFTPMDPFGAGFGQANMGTAFGSMNTTRYSNMLKIQSPNWGGFTAGVGYSFAPQIPAFYTNNGQVYSGAGTGYNFDTANNTRALTLGANYVNGPLTMAASYDQIMPNPNTPGVPGGSSPATVGEWILGGSYNWQVLQLVLAVGQTRGGFINGQNYTSGGNAAAIDGNGGTWGGSSGGVLFGDGVNFTSYLVGVTVPYGQSASVFASWTLAQPSASLTGLAAAAGNQNTYNLGYQYNFTKRTNMYLVGSYGSGPGLVSGVNSTVVVTGIRHQF